MSDSLGAEEDTWPCALWDSAGCIRCIMESVFDNGRNTDIDHQLDLVLDIPLIGRINYPFSNAMHATEGGKSWLACLLINIHALSSLLAFTCSGGLQTSFQ